MKLVKILLALAVIAAAGCDNPAGADGDTAAFTVAAGSVLNGAGSSNAAVRKIKVKFEVLNGGGGLRNNYGIVSTQDDSVLVKDRGDLDRGFTITITVPAGDKYLNVRWLGNDFWLPDTFLKAKMKAESGTITVDYNGVGKAATKNLYDVRVAGSKENGQLSEFAADWKDAWLRASLDPNPD